MNERLVVDMTDETGTASVVFDSALSEVWARLASFYGEGQDEKDELDDSAGIISERIRSNRAFGRCGGSMRGRPMEGVAFVASISCSVQYHTLCILHRFYHMQASGYLWLETFRGGASRLGLGAPFGVLG